MANTNSWAGIGRQILDQYLQSEAGTGGGGDASQMGLDIFNNGFEDEFPGDSEDPAGGTYQGYSLEANRASESRPWGGKFGNRPKVHELNQPPAAQALGWRVIDFYPNRDFKSEFYRLAGTPAELRQMMQIIQATRFVTGARVNFETWFELWEKGFPEFTENRSSSNFLLSGEKQWNRIKKPETRPRYKEWTDSQQRADFGFRVIEYWRDRSAEGSSVLLTGTDSQLIQHCIQLEYEGGSIHSAKNKGGAYPRLSGQPLIRLYFCEDVRSSRQKADKPLVTGEITLRIMTRSDDPKSNLNKISKADLVRYATKLRDLFGVDGGYIWNKGKLTASYRSRNQGFEGWYFVRSRADGELLISKLLGITDQALDKTKIFYSENAEPNVTFPDIPEKILLLGDSIQRPQRRPNVSVRFQKAEIELALLPNPIALVEGDRILYAS